MVHMKKIGWQKGFQKPRTAEQFREIFQQRPVLVPKLKAINIQLGRSGPNQAGLRYFKTFQVPFLRYWNHSLLIDSSTKFKQEPKLVVTLDDNTKKEIPVAGKKETEILEELQKL
eukprot:TRINITY_DN3091_c0_g2_i1.p1 TRINITY_DN3091_c0_g2~~TRINITY_DN3091_c0_g2_i1.p1  ORF type:complete len:126 (+),score=38.14 TRINITY_DN3091_c0_g2_i1:36-380(+)